MLDPGKLRHRVVLQEKSSYLDTHGDQVEGWSTVATLWAAIEPLSAREFVASQALQSAVTARITIRYRAGVVPTMRLLHGAKVYTIAGVLADPESGLEYLTLPCTEGVAEG